jgi:hypothetical protein
MGFTPRRKRWAPALVVLAAIVGLGVYEAVAEGDPSSGSTDTVAAADFEVWPFSVGSGVLRCEQGAVTFEAGGTEYGVNGTATGAGYPEVDPIWLDNPALDGGPKVNISEVLDYGLTLC